MQVGLSCIGSSSRRIEVYIGTSDSGQVRHTIQVSMVESSFQVGLEFVTSSGSTHDVQIFYGMAHKKCICSFGNNLVKSSLVY